MSSGSSSAAPVVAASADAKAKAKARVRGRGAARPAIDLDQEIEEANMLASMSRKLMQAAKSIEKNNKKSKSRLIRKAGKLSPEDLERIAVLKRCGLYADDGGEEAADAAAEASGEAASSGAARPSRLEPKKQKLANLLSDDAGVRSFFDGVREAFPSLTKAATGKSPSGAAGSAASSGSGSVVGAGDSQAEDPTE